MRRLILPWTTVCTASTTVVWLPAGPWMPVSDIGFARATFEIAGISSSDLEIVPGWQTCDEPSTVIAEGPLVGTVSTPGYENANGLYYPDALVDLQTVLGAAQQWRLAWQVKVSQTGIDCARVGGHVDLYPRC
jgi:hypothetical protein